MGTMPHHGIAIRMAEIPRTDNSKCRRGHGAAGMLPHALCSSSPRSGEFRQFLTKRTMCSPYDRATPLPRTCSPKRKAEARGQKRLAQACVCQPHAYNRPEMEVTQTSPHRRWMNTTSSHIHTMEYRSRNKKSTLQIRATA